MKTYEYIRDIRSRTSDSPFPVTITPRLSDSIMITCINNARKALAKEFKCEENQLLIFPIAHQDEYNIPSGYLEITGVYDIKRQQEFAPLNKMNAESTKNTLLGSEAYLYNNLFYLNESRKKIIFKNIPTVAEPVYTISEFDRSAKTIEVDASTGTISDIMAWNTTKSFIKIYDSAGNIEYLRVSEIVDNKDDTYTLYVASFDITNDWIEQTNLYGAVALASAASAVSGTGTKFLTDLDTGMGIYYQNTLKGTVLSVASDTAFTLSATAGVTVASATIAASNVLDYDEDSLQFATYLINYKAEPKDLVMYNDEDTLPHHIQDLVPILAAEECWRRRGRLDMAGQELAEYERKKQKIVTNYNNAQSRLYNKSLR